MKQHLFRSPHLISLLLTAMAIAGFQAKAATSTPTTRISVVPKTIILYMRFQSDDLKSLPGLIFDVTQGNKTISLATDSNGMVEVGNLKTNLPVTIEWEEQSILAPNTTVLPQKTNWNLADIASQAGNIDTITINLYAAISRPVDMGPIPQDGDGYFSPSNSPFWISAATAERDVGIREASFAFAPRFAAKRFLDKKGLLGALNHEVITAVVVNVPAYSSLQDLLIHFSSVPNPINWGSETAFILDTSGGTDNPLLAARLIQRYNNGQDIEYVVGSSYLEAGHEYIVGVVGDTQSLNLKKNSGSAGSGDPSGSTLKKCTPDPPDCSARITGTCSPPQPWADEPYVQCTSTGPATTTGDSMANKGASGCNRKKTGDTPWFGVEVETGSISASNGSGPVKVTFRGRATVTKTTTVYPDNGTCATVWDCLSKTMSETFSCHGHIYIADPVYGKTLKMKIDVDMAKTCEVEDTKGSFPTSCVMTPGA